MLRRKGGLSSRRLRSERSSETATSAEKSRSRASQTPTVKSLSAVIGASRPTPRQIRERAYFIYLARGGVAGDPAADWLRAERELFEEFRRTSETSR